MLGEELDAYRGLVDEGDRCGTVAQIAAFLEAGYEGAFSFECTSPSLQTSGKLEDDIRRSFELIEASLA
jgi:2-keto-myo-inositol isomerase